MANLDVYAERGLGHDAKNDTSSELDSGAGPPYHSTTVSKIRSQEWRMSYLYFTGVKAAGEVLVY